MKAYKIEFLKRFQVAYTVVIATVCLTVAMPLSAQPSSAQLSPEVGALKPVRTGSANSLASSEQQYKEKLIGESEFDNSHDPFAQHWINSQSPNGYEDTEFGELLYSEASTSTKLEVLRLLSKETPSMRVFLAAVSMGLDIEETLQAAVRYQPEKSRELAASAVNVLPILSDSYPSLYSSYELDDLARTASDAHYEVKAVINRFFEKRHVLRPYPDWFQGQYHFLASAKELSELANENPRGQWYHSRSNSDVSNRPVFISLYEGQKTWLIDSQERINQALAKNSAAVLPVVFIFNRLNERAVDHLDYPKTIRGVQQAYLQKQLMLTPPPEWQVGEHHLRATMSDIYQVFEIPNEQDFEPQAWLNLLADAKKYTVEDTSFLITVLPASYEREATTFLYRQGQQLAAWDNPRTEAAFPYVKPRASEADKGPHSEARSLGKDNLRGLLKKGLILNRPDLIAALNALGVTEVPVAFYYLDENRQRPFLKTPRSLIQSVISAGIPATVFGGDGGFSTPVCASPPCTEPQ